MDKVKLGLLGLFIVINMAWLGSVPGLMGDEGSEGENAWELTQAEELVFKGERSYIGPLMDYVRVPFIKVFGYTALALRVPMLIVSIITYLLAIAVLEKTFGRSVGLIGAVMMGFSPIYLTYQRIGWGITLIPFWSFLLLWVLEKKWRYKHLLAGVVAGLGMHTHILFAPTVLAIALVWLIKETVEAVQRKGNKHMIRRILRTWWEWWPAAVGFWAAFGTQMIMLQLFTDDQGDPTAVADLMGQRWHDLPGILRVAVSGSSFIARYTGQEFPGGVQITILGLLCVGVILAIVLPRKRVQAGAWLIGLVIHLSALLYMIDRFTLRYFVLVSLGIWVLSGIGYGKFLKRYSVRWIQLGTITVSGAGAVVFLGLVIWPFLKTGGSLNDFSLGNRTNSAADLVDVQPLIQCVSGLGAIGTENVHIYDRLLYLSHGNSAIKIVGEEDLSEAEYRIYYRDGKTESLSGIEACPELKYFVVEKI